MSVLSIFLLLYILLIFVTLCFRSEEFEQEILEGHKAQSQDELANTANELLRNVNDPKLTNSEVRKILVSNQSFVLLRHTQIFNL